jgi:hypothetical protein
MQHAIRAIPTMAVRGKYRYSAGGQFNLLPYVHAPTLVAADAELVLARRGLSGSWAARQRPLPPKAPWPRYGEQQRNKSCKGQNDHSWRMA